MAERNRAIPVCRSPLAHRRAIEAAGAVRMAERPFVGKHVLRVDRHAAAEPLRAALGLGLPFDALTSSTAGGASLLWLGPDEWLLVTAPGETAERAAAAAGALAGIHHQLVDVSDYYTIVELAGGKARELLMKLTTLDLHPRAFRAGMVTGAVLGKANAVIWQPLGDETEDGPVFRLFVRWSHADYLWCVLAECGRECGLPEQIPVKGETLVVA